MKCFILFFYLITLTNLANANYLSDQDTRVIGKSLWVYFDKATCRDEFKIYPSQSDSKAYAFNEPVEIIIEELNNTPFNWSAGRWYSANIKNQDSPKGHIIYDTLNGDHGYTKNLYYIEDKSNYDIVLLQSACVSNLAPAETFAIFDQIKKDKIAKNKVIDQEKEIRRVERELKKQADEIVEAQRKEKLIADRLEAEKVKKALVLKNAPKHIKDLSTPQFCEYYGYMLRDEYITDFGSAADMKSIITNEANRRKIKVNKKLVTKQVLRLGINSCELYASWGLPYDENKSVGSFGVHIQHIYEKSGVYVYTENGRVTSWQE